MTSSPSCKCGAAPTAFRASPSTGTGPMCVDCAAVDRVQIPHQPERTGPLPAHLADTPAARIHSSNTLWSHQARALDLLHLGHNIVIATPTASGKTLVFHLHSLDLSARDPEARTLVFYPAKALANDQFLRWTAAAQAAGLPPNCVQQITGDTPMRQREQLLGQATVALMTPDIVHAWLIRTASNHAQRQFLARLRLAITDEAHVYEDVLGSNAAFMFRRLASAAKAAGNARPIQHIAATATIKTPETHLENLTGRQFVKVDLEDNGAPRQPTTLLHVPPPSGEQSLENAAADLLVNIIDHDPTAQVILFIDSRQGAERIAAHARRPDVAPYRAGYLPEERREIENKLRENRIRALVATSALEVGIDMPDLNYGINLGLPPTRKQFHQRMGRVGRSRPARFIILGHEDTFRRHSETLADYYRNSVEGSRLHLNNQFIAYQQALCLHNERQRLPAQTPLPQPPELSWPPIFLDTLDLAAQQSPPQSLAHAHARSRRSAPQLAYSLRSSGEEELEIIPSTEGADQQPIGNINSAMAIKEAYPGALYRHNSRAYTVKEWRRRQGKPYIRILPSNEPPSSFTRPLLRQVAVAQLANATGSHGSHPWRGGYATANLEVWTSVEGYVARTNTASHLVDYLDHAGQDPALSRKSVPMPTTGFFLYMEAPWLSPNHEDGPANLADIAHLLAQDLSYQHSVASQNIGALTRNILIETPDHNAFLLENALLVYDNIHGGLGLTDPITRDLKTTTRRLAHSPSTNAQAIHQLNSWLECANAPFQVPQNPGPSGWWRTFPRDTELQYLAPGGITGIGKKKADRWQNQPVGTLELHDGQLVDVPLSALTEVRPAADWTLWQPSTGHYRPLESD